MTGYKRNRKGTKVEKSFSKDQFGYQEIEARLGELFAKTTMFASKTGDERDEQFEMLFDNMVAVKQIQLLTRRGEDDTDTDMRKKRQMLHDMYKLDEEELADDPDANSVDEIEARIEEDMELFDQYKDHSGLSKQEFEEFQFYAERISRYDTMMETVLDGFIALANGEMEENESIPQMLQDEISGFDDRVADQVNAFNEELDKYTLMFDEASGRYRKVARESNENLAKSQRSVKDHANEVTDFFKKSAEKVAKKGGGLWSGLFGGKNKEDLEDELFGQQRAKLQYLAGSVFPEMVQKADATKEVISNMLEEDLIPVRDKAIFLGNQSAKLQIMYREYHEAAKEISRRLDEEIRPEAEVNKDNGMYYQRGLEEISKKHDMLNAVIEEIHVKLGTYDMLLSQASNLRTSAENTVFRAERTVNHKIPDLLTSISTVQANLTNMQHRNEVNKFSNLSSEVMEVLARTAELQDEWDETEQAVGEGNDKLIDAMNRIALVDQKTEQRRLENNQKRKDDSLKLEDARNDFAKTQEEIKDSQLKLESSTPKRKGPSKPALGDDFTRRSKANKDAEKQEREELKENLEADKAAANDDKAPKADEPEAPKRAPKKTGTKPSFKK